MCSVDFNKLTFGDDEASDGSVDLQKINLEEIIIPPGGIRVEITHYGATLIKISGNAANAVARAYQLIRGRDFIPQCWTIKLEKWRAEPPYIKVLLEKTAEGIEMIRVEQRRTLRRMRLQRSRYR